MSMSPSDERDLLLPVYGGISEEPVWRTFLQRLLQRTRAQTIALTAKGGNPARQILQRSVTAAGSKPALTIGDEWLANGSLRQNRVYALGELLILDDGDAAKAQRESLEHAGIAHARLIRIPVGEADLWLTLTHDRHDFGAGDSVLLSALAPHLAAALGMLMEKEALRLRVAMAEDALALIGVGQAAFDADGRIAAADAIAAQTLDLQSNGHPRLRGAEARALQSACSDIAKASAGARRAVRIDERTGKDMLLRPTVALPGEPAAIGLVRQPPHRKSAGAAPVIAATLGLSAREAALAEAMARGLSIVEAGAALQLTPETARNYTKRIYAKTGTSGQADLVRLLLTGLAPFA